MGLFASITEAADHRVRLRRAYRHAPAQVEVCQEAFERFCRIRRDMAQIGLFEKMALKE